MTDICRHYAKGNCWRGAYCRFVHPVKPRPPPSIDPALVTRGYIKLGCLEFRATRKCAQGKECHYIHEPVQQSIGGFSSVLEEYEREKEKERENEVTLK
jgi:hypothetical protein